MEGVVILPVFLPLLFDCGIIICSHIENSFIEHEICLSLYNSYAENATRLFAENSAVNVRFHIKHGLSCGIREALLAETAQVRVLLVGGNDAS